jgi:predicted transposase/invertase (TIGR01784 family)
MARKIKFDFFLSSILFMFCVSKHDLFFILKKIAMSRYINPFTDFGFKHLFGSESNKDILISFLNAVLPDQTIADLQYKNVERQGITEAERKVIFDLHCENEKGEKFIVELQRAKQDYFKDRTIYYSTFPIQEQTLRGDEWNYELKHVYTISILNFRFQNPITKKKDTTVKQIIKLIDTETKEVFYDKLTFVYLQMPNFTKTEEELETIEDKWYYVLRNLDILERMPPPLQEKIFSYFFDSAELAKLPLPTRMEYEESLKQLRDWKNVMQTAEREAKEKGMREGLREGKKKGLKQGLEQGREEERKKAQQKEIAAIKNLLTQTDFTVA